MFAVVRRPVRPKYTGQWAFKFKCIWCPIKIAYALISMVAPIVAESWNRLPVLGAMLRPLVREFLASESFSSTVFFLFLLRSRSEFTTRLAFGGMELMNEVCEITEVEESEAWCGCVSIHNSSCFMLGVNRSSAGVVA